MITSSVNNTDTDNNIKNNDKIDNKTVSGTVILENRFPEKNKGAGFVTEEYKILENNFGTIFLVKASTVGASF